MGEAPAASIRFAWRWITDPVSLAAALVMVVNDHVLKGAYPGAVTGKLSDLAGVIVAPPLLALALALVFPRVRVSWLMVSAVVLVAAGFAWVKTTSVGAAAAADLWSLAAGRALVQRDPSDLLAIPALGVALVVARRCAGHAREGPSNVGRPVAGVRAGAAALFVVLAVTATTPPVGPPYVAGVVEWRGQVVAVTHHECMAASADGRGGWHCLGDGDEDELSEELVAAEKPEVVEACVPDAPWHCYRVIRRDDPGIYAFDSAGLTVEESVDTGASWQVVWRLEHGRDDYVRRAAPQGTYVDIGLRDIGQIVVRAPRSGGHVVVIANGLDGLLVGEAGEWRRAGFPELPQFPQPAPLRRFGAHIERELGAMPLVALLIWMIACRVVLGSSRGIAPTAVGWIMLGLAWSIGWPLESDEFTGVLMLLVLVPLVVPGVVAVMAGLTRTISRSQASDAVSGTTALRIAVVSVATAVAYVLPFLGWTVAYPADYRTAGLISVALTTGGAIGGIRWLRIVSGPSRAGSQG